ncbi:hybrid sensor histidine kinase/response regulator [Aggregatilinea lenta]|uniref:hybrid sensor histidine kinase/response regulator n=1 Tax=Aggregatilinea lenta TaxID=913108 RepID=UPI0013C2E6D3|nr:HAMP domain-containing sensor histidine kinase [Aggregatilinea lenta]
MNNRSTDARAAIILFVDDNAALLRSVERLLRMEGFQTLLASDGSEALHLMESVTQLPDLIISDIAMPRMDGFELFETIRQRPEWMDIPFLFLTARDQLDDLRRGYALGADDYLVKPLDQERLIMIIRGKLKRRTELLESIQSQQDALSSAKRELSLMVAHELRTPLVSISMVTDILSRELNKMGAGQLDEMVDTMQSGSSRLSRLVEQMVLYVQFQSGALLEAIEMAVRPGYVRDAIIGAIDRARQFNYRRRDIAVRFEELDPGMMISGDLASLRQAMAEVISNAMAFSQPTDEVQITQWVAENLVWITITDQGPGIPEDELERVFEPFHQSNRQRFEQQGIGIGLALARGIIEAHGGALMLRSKEGRGTQVTISLPLYGADDSFVDPY